MEDILSRMRECIRSVKSGSWIEHLAELRIVPPDGVYVIMPYLEMSIHPLTEDPWDEPRVRESGEHK